VKYSDVRLADERQFSVYNFEMADVGRLWQLFDIHEAECQRLIDAYADYPEKSRFPVLPAYDQVLKCSNLFNLLDARGAISVTERVGVIGRVRKLAVGVAGLWVAQQSLQQEAA
jgi:glycyl-tRNA synthetase alpha chain